MELHEEPVRGVRRAVVDEDDLPGARHGVEDRGESLGERGQDLLLVPERDDDGKPRGVALHRAEGSGAPRRPCLSGPPAERAVTRPRLAAVKAPKILAVASAVDLDFRYGCTPAWWQLWKGMYEAGVDLVVTPYRGRPVESPWWRTAPNPTYREGESYQAIRNVVARLQGDDYIRRAETEPRGLDGSIA